MRFRMRFPSGEFGRRLFSTQLVASLSFAGSGKQLLLWHRVEARCDCEEGAENTDGEVDREDDENNEVVDEEVAAVAAVAVEADGAVGIRVRNWASPARVVNCRIMLLSSSLHFESGEPDLESLSLWRSDEEGRGEANGVVLGVNVGVSGGDECEDDEGVGALKQRPTCCGPISQISFLIARSSSSLIWLPCVEPEVHTSCR